MCWKSSFATRDCKKPQKKHQISHQITLKKAPNSIEEQDGESRIEELGRNGTILGGGGKGREGGAAAGVEEDDGKASQLSRVRFGGDLGLYSELGLYEGFCFETIMPPSNKLTYLPL